MAPLFDSLPISFLGAFLCCLSALGYSKIFRVEAWDVRLISGFGIQGILFFLCAFLGIWNVYVIGILLLCGILLGMQGWMSIQKPLLQGSTLWLFCVIGLLSFVDASVPVTDTDALYYHLALAKQMVFQESLVGGWFEPNGSRPMLLHMSYSCVYGLFGEQSPIFLYWMLSMSLLASVAFRSKGGGWGLLLLVSSWSFFQELGVLANNIPTAFALFLTWRMVVEERYKVATFLAFVTISFKLTALGAIAAIWLIYVPTWKIKVQLLVGTLLLFLLWPLRNLWEGLPFLFPYMGWSEPFQHLDKYGMGRELWDFLLLPYNIFVYAKPDSHIFQGQLSPMLAAAGGLLFWANRKEKMLLIFGFVFWAFGPQWLRHLMLLLPLYVYIVVPFCRGRVCKSILILGLIWGMSSNWGRLLIRWGEAAQVLVGEVSEERYKKENIVGYEALLWVDTKLPSDACPALVYVWSGSVLSRPYILSSVEDHIPIRDWILKHREESLDILPCSYLVMGSPAIHRKRYAFLEDKEYNRLFAEPIAYLEELLLQQGHLIYTRQGFRVYRIEKYLDKI